LSLGNGFGGVCDRCGDHTIVYGVANGHKYCRECIEEEDREVGRDG